MNLPTHEDIEALHALYCRLTGLKLSLRFDRERYWYEWLRIGFTEGDLRLVIRNLRRKKQFGTLKFSVLIERPDRFEEELVEAKAHQRNNAPLAPREEIMQVFRPRLCDYVPEEFHPKMPGPLVDKLIEEMRKAAK